MEDAINKRDARFAISEKEKHMRYGMVWGLLTISVLFLLSCLPAAPAVPEGRTPPPPEKMTIPIESVEELRTYRGGEKQVYQPQAERIAETTERLLGVLSKLNLQATCFFGDEDVARVREEGDSLELVFAQPVDIRISQWIEEDERDHIPTDERGYRVLRVKRALFVLGGEMAGHVLIRDEEGGWGCWAIEREGEIDTRWIEAVQGILEE